MQDFDVIVIGAGTAGSFAAKQLHTLGYTVMVLEKSRGAGGRCARRQVGEDSVDIGCVSLDQHQLHTAQQSPRVAEQLQQWQQQGLLAAWTVNYGAGDEHHSVGVPQMNCLHKDLLNGIAIATEQRVHRFERSEHNHWLVECLSGDVFRCKTLIVTAPPAQANDMSHAWPNAWLSVFDDADATIQAQWTIVVELPSDILLPHNGYHHHPVIEHAVLDSSKPQRDHTRQLWVVQASPAWTDRHLHLDKEHAGDLLCDAFCAMLDIPSESATLLNTHRWLFGRTDHQYTPDGCLWDSERQLAVCADWLNGGTVTGALMSAAAVVNHMTEQENTDVA
ncbi:MAG TPA: NAD(P)-binding protein [Pseudomonadales bacterium]|nr:NAD(P)-binding protein [Pseudomonadales bacterium]